MAKKLRLITEDEYRQLSKTPTVRHIREHYFQDAAKEASSILEKDKIPEDFKIQLYSSVMNSVKNQLTEILNRPIKLDISIDGENVRKLKPTSREDNAKSSKLTVSSAVDEDESEFEDFYTTPPSGPSLVATPKTFSKSMHDPTMRDELFSKEFPNKIKYSKAIPLLEQLKKRPDLITWDSEGRVTYFGSEPVEDSNIVDLISYATRDLIWERIPPGTNRFLQVCKLSNVPSTFLSKKLRDEWQGGLEGINPRETYTESAKKQNAFSDWQPLRANDSLSQQIQEELSAYGLGPTTPYLKKVNCESRRKRQRVACDLE